MNRPIVLASANAKKLRELRQLVSEAGLDLTVFGLADVAPYPEPAETERTFAGNALLKARACAAATGLPSLADDSGLMVDELGGMPGVRSARWAGPAKDDMANLELVLRQLADVPAQRRGAAFVCALALVLPDGREEVAMGELRGRLIEEPHGSSGFGYDPIFVPDGSRQTTAQMTVHEKNAISHRARAVRAMMERLPRILGAPDA